MTAPDRVYPSQWTEKTCTWCNQTKPIDAFGRSPRIQFDGRLPMCKACRNADQRAYRASLRDGKGIDNAR